MLQSKESFPTLILQPPSESKKVSVTEFEGSFASSDKAISRYPQKSLPDSPQSQFSSRYASQIRVASSGQDSASLA